MRKKEFYETECTDKQISQHLTESLEQRLKVVQRILEGFPYKNGEPHRLLDIGCRTGNITETLRQSTGACEVYGVEISRKAAEIAEKRGVKVFCLDIDEQNIPVGDSFFDVIFLGEIIEHLYDPDHLLEETYRVLRSGSICILTTPNLASWFNRICLLFGYQPFWTGISLKYNYVGKLKRLENDEGVHIRAFTLRALKDLVKVHGFTIWSIKGANETYPFPILLRPVAKFANLFPSLSSRIILALTK